MSLLILKIENESFKHFALHEWNSSRWRKYENIGGKYSSYVRARNGNTHQVIGVKSTVCVTLIVSSIKT